MKKILLGILILLATPIILFLILISLALFVPATQCPQTEKVDVAANLDQKQKQLDKTGSIVITDAEATQAINQNFSQNEQIQNIRICFTPNHLNASGKLKLGNFNPSFYISTYITAENNIEATDTQATIGGLGFLGRLFGGLAEDQINNQLKTAQLQGSYEVKFTQGQVEIKTTKKPSRKF